MNLHIVDTICKGLAWPLQLIRRKPLKGIIYFFLFLDPGLRPRFFGSSISTG